MIRIVTNESIVNFKKNKYSIPTKYIGSEMEIEKDPNEIYIEIYLQGELIQTH
ncbi:Mu transposase domain-containing protein [Enterococcus sp. AZ128]|uniref:Mu transposase domain-containing protein n=1 Tax=unclassified Enterococcus TaxID=2608891 RepID=UPI003F684F98